MAIQQSKKRYRVIIKDKKSGRVLSDEEQTSTYGVFIHGLTPSSLRVPESYIVTVEYVGDHQFKVPYARRLAAQKKNEERAEKARIKMEEAALILRRDRIMNQIELAFVKNGKDAVNFVTCDECEAPAKFLGLTHENAGSMVISPEQITGAMCDQHHYHKPFKTTAVIACAILEFFYDGIKQIYINRPAQQVGS
jgi:hypothetical protein